MPHSLRSKLKGLNYKKILTDRELDRLCKALDNEDVLDKIRAEIDFHSTTFKDGERYILKDRVFDIIDKYR